MPLDTKTNKQTKHYLNKIYFCLIKIIAVQNRHKSFSSSQITGIFAYIPWA